MENANEFDQQHEEVQHEEEANANNDNDYNNDDDYDNNNDQQNQQQDEQQNQQQDEQQNQQQNQQQDEQQNQQQNQQQNEPLNIKKLISALKPAGESTKYEKEIVKKLRLKNKKQKQIQKKELVEIIELSEIAKDKGETSISQSLKKQEIPWLNNSDYNEKILQKKAEALNKIVNNMKGEKIYLDKNIKEVRDLLEKIELEYNPNGTIKKVKYEGETISQKKNIFNKTQIINNKKILNEIESLTNKKLSSQIFAELGESVKYDDLSNSINETIKKEREISKREIEISENDEKILDILKKNIELEDQISLIKNNEPTPNKKLVTKIVDYLKKNKFKSATLLSSISLVIISFVTGMATGFSSIASNIEKELNSAKKEVSYRIGKIVEHFIDNEKKIISKTIVVVLVCVIILMLVKKVSK